MRILAPLRLSRSTDESVSIDTQSIAIEEWASAHGHTIVKATQDLDVSRGVPIRQRPEIGPWLTPGHLGEWDALVGYKTDRMFRDQYDFVTTFHDLIEPNDKVIISVGEGIDSSTDMGKYMLGQLVQFAEWELNRMADRRSDAAQRLRFDARWNGGTVPFAYMAVLRSRGDGYDLVPHPERAPVVRKMADRAIARKSAAAIAHWLNAEGIPSPQDGFKLKGGGTRQGQWRSTGVLAVLRNPVLRGYVVQVMAPKPGRAKSKGRRFAAPKIIRNPDGTPVRREPILDDVTWFRLQAALDEMSKPQANPRCDAHPLLGVGFCLKCGAALYSATATANWNRPARTLVRFKYYSCSKRAECHARGIRMPDLDASIEAEIIARYSATLYPEKFVMPGVDHAKELDVIDGQIAELDAAYKSGEIPARAYGRLVTELETARETLDAEQTPGGVEYLNADDTIAERFTAASLEGRRAILLDLGITVHAALAAGKQSRYAKMAAALRNDILTGRLAPGTRLPSRLEYARDHGMGINAGERAYNLLRAEGFVRCDGHKWFVASQVPEAGPADIYDGRVIDMELRGGPLALAAQPGP